MTTTKTKEITSESGRRWLLRIVERGDKYGREDCLTHADNQPMVEFYDLENVGKDFGFGGRGQFVSRYYVETIDEHPRNAGLNLDGGVPVWSLNYRDMRAVNAFLGLDLDNSRD